MAELSTLARPYAKAAFEYALDRNQLGQWYDQLATAAAVRGGIRIAAVDDAAQTAGIVPGLTLADARALLPDLAVADADAAKAVSAANAHAAAVGRWASSITNGSPLPEYNLAYEAAIVARTEVIAAANAHAT